MIVLSLGCLWHHKNLLVFWMERDSNLQPFDFEPRLLLHSMKKIMIVKIFFEIRFSTALCLLNVKLTFRLMYIECRHNNNNNNNKSIMNILMLAQNMKLPQFLLLLPTTTSICVRGAKPPFSPFLFYLPFWMAFAAYGLRALYSIPTNANRRDSLTIHFTCFDK